MESDEEQEDPFSEGTFLPGTFRLWPDTRRGPWLLQLEWQVLEGRAECVGMKLTSAAPKETPEWSLLRVTLRDDRQHGTYLGRPLGSALLRGLALGRILAEDRKALRRVSKGWSVYADAGSPRHKNAPVFLAEVAKTYSAAWANGEPTAKAVASRFSYSEGGARKLIWQARQAGLLPETSTGVARAVRSPRRRKKRA